MSTRIGHVGEGFPNTTTQQHNNSAVARTESVFKRVIRAICDFFARLFNRESSNFLGSGIVYRADPETGKIWLIDRNEQILTTDTSTESLRSTATDQAEDPKGHFDQNNNPAAEANNSCNNRTGSLRSTATDQAEDSKKDFEQIHPNNLENWNLDGAQAPGLSDRKRVNIIVEPTEQEKNTRAEVVAFLHLENSQPSIEPLCRAINDNNAKWVQARDKYIQTLKNSVKRLSVDTKEEIRKIEARIGKSTAERTEYLGMLISLVTEHSLTNELEDSKIAKLTELERQINEDVEKIQDILCGQPEKIFNGKKLQKEIFNARLDYVRCKPDMQTLSSQIQEHIHQATPSEGSDHQLNKKIATRMKKRRN